eukprot:GEMP01098449.1.p1 GENE.GEMP01098449.1~~GEMP01098449.1.p1  ORF type:complete len:106 (+),score=28.94 GEMP01098449.1:64-381(+)
MLRGLFFIAASAFLFKTEKVKISKVQLNELPSFGSAPEACDACFASYTKQHVNPSCVCMARSGAGGNTFFCAQNLGASKYVEENDGCRCKQNDMQNLGQTTCNPF